MAPDARCAVRGAGPRRATHTLDAHSGTTATTGRLGHHADWANRPNDDRTKGARLRADGLPLTEGEFQINHGGSLQAGVSVCLIGASQICRAKPTCLPKCHALGRIDNVAMIQAPEIAAARALARFPQREALHER